MTVEKSALITISTIREKDFNQVSEIERDAYSASHPFYDIIGWTSSSWVLLIHSTTRDLRRIRIWDVLDLTGVTAGNARAMADQWKTAHTQLFIR